MFVEVSDYLSILPGFFELSLGEPRGTADLFRRQSAAAILRHQIGEQFCCVGLLSLIISVGDGCQAAAVRQFPVFLDGTAGKVGLQMAHHAVGRL